MDILALLRLFPWELFLIFFSATLLIRLCQQTGVFDQMTNLGLRLCGKKAFLVPPLVFILAFAISFVGAGNIAATALIAPAALELGRKLKLSTFSMSLLVIGGVNSAVMSPFAPTGIITRQIVSKFLPAILNLDFFLSNLFIPSFLFSALVHIAGFLFFGGAAWMLSTNNSKTLASLDLKAKPWSFSQKIALLLLIFFFSLNLVFGIERLLVFVPLKLHIFRGEVAYFALLCVVISLALKMASLKRALKELPWNLFILVCGISFLLSLIEHTIGFSFISNFGGHFKTYAWTLFFLAFASGLLSVFSSSSGVVLPLFLPLVPALNLNGHGNLLGPVICIVVASHLVDCSPFSSLGALCISTEKRGSPEAKLLLKRLFYWGLSMVLVGAALSFMFSHFLFI